MKQFTTEFASHFTLDEYIHYLECDCIQGIDRIPIRVLKHYAATLEEARQRAQHHEDQAAEADKDRTEAEADKKELEDKLAQLNKKLQLAMEGIEASMKNLEYIKRQFALELL
jgi:chromosome segregation ATPase